ncbi:hypothetical protein P3T76_002665 [Phytophthora citrophthora]|uniref:Restriction endonuclease domain-containing protein n=1 Tax=Phytophthora citrophthora TaxID=4793 RepID=A0AAD9GVN6_9STRA|nr:hypothetical protein P3T76_002665 [Phytophthora citrophthora]
MWQIRELDWDAVRDALDNDDHFVLPLRIPPSREDWASYVETENQALPTMHMMWNNNSIFIVELPGDHHAMVAGEILGAIRDATSTGSMHLVGYTRCCVSNLAGLGALAYFGALEPDTAFGPRQGVPGVMPPPGMTFTSFHTLKIEVGVSQSWGRVDDGRSFNYKADMWRQYPGVQYILCIYVSSDFDQYRLDSVVNGAFENQNRGPIDITEDTAVLSFDARRLLGLRRNEILPPLFNDPVEVDLFDIVELIETGIEQAGVGQGAAGLGQIIAGSILDAAGGGQVIAGSILDAAGGGLIGAGVGLAVAGAVIGQAEAGVGLVAAGVG